MDSLCFVVTMKTKRIQETKCASQKVCKSQNGMEIFLLLLKVLPVILFHVGSILSTWTTESLLRFGTDGSISFVVQPIMAFAFG